MVCLTQKQIVGKAKSKAAAKREELHQEGKLYRLHMLRLRLSKGLKPVEKYCNDINVAKVKNRIKVA